jgi:hypothetical protein
MLASVQLTPSNFSGKVDRIQQNDTVHLAAGDYRVSARQRNALQRAGSLIGVPGETALDFRGHSDVQILNIRDARGGKVSGLHFLNGGVRVENSPNFSIENNAFMRFEGKHLANGPNDQIVSMTKSNGGSILANSIQWQNTSLNVRAMAVRLGENYTIADNTVIGRLKQGIGVNWTSGGLVTNNLVRRAQETPRIGTRGEKGAGKHALGEDHGIYMLNTSATKIEGNTTSGWSIKASGFGLKLKDVADIQVERNHFAAGILGRINPKHNDRLGFRNVSIRNNTLDRGGINVLTGGVVQNLETAGNTLGSGNISIDNPSTNALVLAKR